MDRPQWSPIEDPPPPGSAVLIWIDGAFAIAILVEGEDAGGHWRVFMDSRSDEILPWPSHWLPLPPAPLPTRSDKDV
jgi:hypothetical protein